MRYDHWNDAAVTTITTFRWPPSRSRWLTRSTCFIFYDDINVCYNLKLWHHNNKLRAEEGRIMLELIKKRKRNWLGHWLRRNCLLKDGLEGMVNGKKVRSKRIYYMIDNITINWLYEDTKRKTKMRVEWRMLSLQWKTFSWAEHCDWFVDIYNQHFS